MMLLSTLIAMMLWSLKPCCGASRYPYQDRRGAYYCPPIHQPLCASNGVGYVYFENQCQLDVRNYLEKRYGNQEYIAYPLSRCYPQCKTCPDIENPVCVIDGRTQQLKEVKNPCEVEFAACAFKKYYRIIKYGLCPRQSSCEESSCKNDYRPICVNYKTMYREFPNDCEFQKSLCGNTMNWQHVQLGPCQDNGLTKAIVTPICTAHNGENRTFESYNQWHMEMKKTGKYWSILHEGVCKDRLSCRGEIIKPVCAQLNATTIKSFLSLCHLQKEKKQTGLDWAILYRGVCRSPIANGGVSSGMTKTLTQDDIKKMGGEISKEPNGNETLGSLSFGNETKLNAEPQISKPQVLRRNFFTTKFSEKTPNQIPKIEDISKTNKSESLGTADVGMETKPEAESQVSKPKILSRNFFMNRIPEKPTNQFQEMEDAAESEQSGIFGTDNFAEENPNQIQETEDIKREPIAEPPVRRSEVLSRDFFIARTVAKNANPLRENEKNESENLNADYFDMDSAPETESQIDEEDVLSRNLFIERRAAIEPNEKHNESSQVPVQKSKLTDVNRKESSSPSNDDVLFEFGVLSDAVNPEDVQGNPSSTPLKGQGKLKVNAGVPNGSAAPTSAAFNEKNMPTANLIKGNENPPDPTKGKDNANKMDNSTSTPDQTIGKGNANKVDNSTSTPDQTKGKGNANKVDNSTAIPSNTPTPGKSESTSSSTGKDLTQSNTTVSPETKTNFGTVEQDVSKNSLRTDNPQAVTQDVGVIKVINGTSNDMPATQKGTNETPTERTGNTAPPSETVASKFEDPTAGKSISNLNNKTNSSKDSQPSSVTEESQSTSGVIATTQQIVDTTPFAFFIEDSSTSMPSQNTSDTLPEPDPNVNMAKGTVSPIKEQSDPPETDIRKFFADYDSLSYDYVNSVTEMLQDVETSTVNNSAVGEATEQNLIPLQFVANVGHLNVKTEDATQSTLPPVTPVTEGLVEEAETAGTKGTDLSSYLYANMEAIDLSESGTTYPPDAVSYSNDDISKGSEGVTRQQTNFRTFFVQSKSIGTNVISNTSEMAINPVTDFRTFLVKSASLTKDTGTTSTYSNNQVESLNNTEVPQISNITDNVADLEGINKKITEQELTPRELWVEEPNFELDYANSSNTDPEKQNVLVKSPPQDDTLLKVHILSEGNQTENNATYDGPGKDQVYSENGYAIPSKALESPTAETDAENPITVNSGFQIQFVNNESGPSPETGVDLAHSSFSLPDQVQRPLLSPEKSRTKQILNLEAVATNPSAEQEKFANALQTLQEMGVLLRVVNKMEANDNYGNPYKGILNENTTYAADSQKSTGTEVNKVLRPRGRKTQAAGRRDRLTVSANKASSKSLDLTKTNGDKEIKVMQNVTQTSQILRNGLGYESTSIDNSGTLVKDEKNLSSRKYRPLYAMQRLKFLQNQPSDTDGGKGYATKSQDSGTTQDEGKSTSSLVDRREKLKVVSQFLQELGILDAITGTDTLEADNKVGELSLRQYNEQEPDMPNDAGEDVIAEDSLTTADNDGAFDTVSDSGNEEITLTNDTEIQEAAPVNKQLVQKVNNNLRLKVANTATKTTQNSKNNASSTIGMISFIKQKNGLKNQTAISAPYSTYSMDTPTPPNKSSLKGETSRGVKVESSPTSPFNYTNPTNSTHKITYNGAVYTAPASYSPTFNIITLPTEHLLMASAANSSYHSLPFNLSDFAHFPISGLYPDKSQVKPLKSPRVTSLPLSARPNHGIPAPSRKGTAQKIEYPPPPLPHRMPFNGISGKDFPMPSRPHDHRHGISYNPVPPSASVPIPQPFYTPVPWQASYNPMNLMSPQFPTHYNPFSPDNYKPPYSAANSPVFYSNNNNFDFDLSPDYNYDYDYNAWSF